MAGLSVLLVDDDPIFLKLMETQLDKLGIADVLAVSSGGQALQSLTFRTPDLIISDIMMPGFGGIEFLNALETRGFRGKFAFVSGSKGPYREAASRLAQFSELSVIGEFAKPVSLATMQEIVGKTLAEA